ncbi:hypothetical protein BUALT_Bualt06G0079700 [Buddleja alternifolia]|uniref:FAD-binding PCMH-type domain-containing protein n=1 Tax=Buddleja alternifolia TaxID=168488 RepID=A0AAV6XKB2_9LAMI|nr:hypothetical protein BUALT_Bualt06G0079700 [Buddleja alternifolia]
MESQIIHRKFIILYVLAALSIWGAAASSSSEDFLECLGFELQKLDKLYSSDIFYSSNNASFTSILQSSAFNLRLGSSSSGLQKPVAIITPLHESQIQASVYCFKNHNIQLRVRSGGHDFEGLSYVSYDNSSNSFPFAVVDMRNLRSISIDTETNTAWVQTGATLGLLYATIAQNSKTLGFPAGTCPSVGVGGHFSGGGYGMMSRAHGLASDNIIDVVLVDADARILDRESMGEDHFWATRGGGGASFGIIVAFKIKLVNVPEIVTVFNVSRTLEQNATQLIHKWQYIADKVDENLSLRLFMTSPKVSDDDINDGGGKKNKKRTVVAHFTSLFLGGVDHLLTIMKETFPELGVTNEDCTEMSWIEAMIFFAQLPLNNTTSQLIDDLSSGTGGSGLSKTYFKGKSDYVRVPIPEDGLTGIWEYFKNEDGWLGEVQFSPYGGRINDLSETQTPFPHRAGNIYMIEYGIHWDEARISESQKHINWIRRLHNYMAPYVSNSPRAQYINYRDLDVGKNNLHGYTSYNQASSWGFKYFKMNFDRLVRVKTKVDPTNFFRNEQSIPPLPSLQINTFRDHHNNMKEFVQYANV